MKEYKVEGRPLNSNRWWSIGNNFDNVEQAKERVIQEKEFDELHTKSPENWEYRILVREVSNWEIM